MSELLEQLPSDNLAPASQPDQVEPWLQAHTRVLKQEAARHVVAAVLIGTTALAFAGELRSTTPTAYAETTHVMAAY